MGGSDIVIGTCSMTGHKLNDQAQVEQPGNLGKVSGLNLGGCTILQKLAFCNIFADLYYFWVDLIGSFPSHINVHTLMFMMI